MARNLKAADRSAFRWRLFAITTVWASSIFTLIATTSMYLGQSPDKVASQKEQLVRHAQAR
jgi:hypothetical protein